MPIITSKIGSMYIHLSMYLIYTYIYMYVYKYIDMYISTYLCMYIHTVDMYVHSASEYIQKQWCQYAIYSSIIFSNRKMKKYK